MLTKLKGAVQGWVATQHGNSQMKANLRGYADCLGRMLQDLTLTPQELQILDNQRRSLGLDSQGVHQVHQEAFKHLSAAVLADGVITAPELQALADIGRVLGVPWDVLPLDHRQTYYIAHSCMQIQAGNLPSLPPQASALRQNSGEIVHAEIPAQMLDERVIARQYVGGYSGMSVRICKGVSHRFGGTRGRSIPVTAVVPIDRGILSITNSRIVFIGQKKSFSVDWPKVLSIAPMADGVHLAFQGRTKSALLQYIANYDAEIVTAILSYYVA